MDKFGVLEHLKTISEHNDVLFRQVYQLYEGARKKLHESRSDQLVGNCSKEMDLYYDSLRDDAMLVIQRRFCLPEDAYFTTLQAPDKRIRPESLSVSDSYRPKKQQAPVVKETSPLDVAYKDPSLGQTRRVV